MPHIQGVQRDAVVLFPPSLDEYITDDNPVRFIDAFVDQLDLQELGFRRAVAAPTGRPAYHPADLLKLYIYGYLNRIRSSRLLERESQRNVELIWLLKKLTPDFKTIADFRKDNLQPIRQVCRSFTLLCKQLDLFGGELIAIDGSKFKAWNNRKRNWTDERLQRALQEIDEKIARYLHDFDAQDDQQPNPPRLSTVELQERIAQLRARQQHYTAIREQLADSGETQISLTDPDSRSMSVGQGVDVCYNVQVVTDAKHKLIVAEEVTNAVTDRDQLAPMALQAKAVLETDTLDATADMGYAHGEQVKQCEAAGITAYVPKPHTSRNQRKGLFTKDDFRYDPANDTYTCPDGAILTFRFQTKEKERETRYYATTACGTCPIKAKCTENKRGRRITRWADEHILEQMERRVQARPDILRQRKELVEHVFGTMKRHLQHGYFLLRTLPKVRAEFSLTVLTYNLKRVIAILGVPKLLAALRDQAILEKVVRHQTGLDVFVKPIWWVHRWLCQKTKLGRKFRAHPCRVFTHSDAPADALRASRSVAF